MRLVPAERTAICELFEDLGPTVPTVLPGWQAEDLLAHLLVRERNPLAAPGILIPALSGLADSAMHSYDTTPWAKRVELLRSGPPLWSPYRPALVEERANLLEFVVHYEDLARAQDRWRARPPSVERDEALWSALRLAARVMYRKSQVGVVLHHLTRERGADITARPGRGRVVVTGTPTELVLHAFGREMAQVELNGTPDNVAELAATPRGI
jgi:uncharacterized protein (TIGR03085 family)